jgi:hypothetical protein
VLHNPVADLIAQVEVVHEDMPHGLCLKELHRAGGGFMMTTRQASSYHPQTQLPACSQRHILYASSL